MKCTFDHYIDLLNSAAAIKAAGFDIPEKEIIWLGACMGFDTRVAAGTLKAPQQNAAGILDDALTLAEIR